METKNFSSLSKEVVSRCYAADEKVASIARYICYVMVQGLEGVSKIPFEEFLRLNNVQALRGKFTPKANMVAACLHISGHTRII